MLNHYEQLVYTSLLGKVIGVYMGRPVENWRMPGIREKFGLVDRYVAAEQGVPLVVADDDISGTVTFVRALEDSGLYADTPEDFFGKTWLNYLIEKKTILWWGGLGYSTEHTAYLNLKHGIPSPESGSMKRNGRKVAEQIGAQIFIDAFGMVAPGEPLLAARLAEKAARVSHDGEAVYAAQAVAAMVAKAFVEHDMTQVLNSALKVIPKNCLIAQVHRDVRNWVELDGDWEKTFARIDRKYGYHIYGGNCHVIPNHAVIVMALAYAQNDFHKAMVISNTVGWDTDCNAANVGSIAALAAGLNHLCDSYDYLTPIAGRVLLPTADGSGCCDDVMRHALHIAAIGRRLHGEAPAPRAKNGAYFSFEFPGALQGFQAVENAASVTNEASQHSGGRVLQAVFAKAGSVEVATKLPASNGPYLCAGTPFLYNGMTTVLRGICTEVEEPAQLHLYVRTTKGILRESPTESVRQAGEFQIAWQLEGLESEDIEAFGFALSRPGTLQIDSVDFGGKVHLFQEDCFDYAWVNGKTEAISALTDLDSLFGEFSDDAEKVMHYGKNEERGFFILGNRDWSNPVISGRLLLHCGKRAGLVACYQGRERYYSLVCDEREVTLLRRSYGTETVLAAAPLCMELDRLYPLTLKCEDGVLTAFLAEEKLFEAKDTAYCCGGAGYFVEEALAAFRETKIEAAVI